MSLEDLIFVMFILSFMGFMICSAYIIAKHLENHKP